MFLANSLPLQSALDMGRKGRWISGPAQQDQRTWPSPQYRPPADRRSGMVEIWLGIFLSGRYQDGGSADARHPHGVSPYGPDVRAPAMDGGGGGAARDELRVDAGRAVGAARLPMDGLDLLRTPVLRQPSRFVTRLLMAIARLTACRRGAQDGSGSHFACRGRSGRGRCPDASKESAGIAEGTRRWRSRSIALKAANQRPTTSF